MQRRRADSARDARDWPAAAAAYRTALLIHSWDAPIWVQYGHALKEHGELRSAERAYRKAVQIDPGHFDAYLHLGGLLAYHFRDWNAAADAYRAALEIRQDAATVWLQHGHMLAELGDVVGAARGYCEAIKLEAAYAEAHGRLAAILQQKLPEWPVRVAIYRAVLEIPPTNAATWILHGHALRGLGDLTGAEKACRKAAELGPESLDVHLNLARLMIGLRRFDEAAESYRRALDLDPDSVEARESLERLEIARRPEPRPERPWGTLDPRWQVPLEAALPFLHPDDRVLLPEGDWPSLPFLTRRFRHVVELGDATAILLPKDRISGLKKTEAAGLLTDWQCLHAAPAVLVMATPRKYAPEARRGTERHYVTPLEEYVNSRALKSSSGTLYFLHLPKTGGTSLWRFLLGAFRSTIYYASAEAFSANPPQAGEYDAVGAHCSFAMIAQHLTPGDTVVSLVRDPTRRFVSAVLFSRRSGADPAEFTPSMRAMRERSVAEFLDGGQARHELLMQLLSLGGARDADPEATAPEALLANALTLLDREDVILAPMEEMARLTTLLTRRFGFPAAPVPVLNVSDPAAAAIHSAEFEAARSRIEAENCLERLLYDAVRQRFDAWSSRGNAA